VLRVLFGLSDEPGTELGRKARYDEAAVAMQRKTA
jgi:hypothetical protein